MKESSSDEEGEGEGQDRVRQAPAKAKKVSYDLIRHTRGIHLYQWNVAITLSAFRPNASLSITCFSVAIVRMGLKPATKAALHLDTAVWQNLTLSSLQSQRNRHSVKMRTK